MNIGGKVRDICILPFIVPTLPMVGNSLITIAYPVQSSALSPTTANERGSVRGREPDLQARQD